MVNRKTQGLGLAEGALAWSRSLGNAARLPLPLTAISRGGPALGPVDVGATFQPCLHLKRI